MDDLPAVGATVRKLGTDEYFVVTEILFNTITIFNEYRRLTRKLSLEHFKWAYEEATP